MASPGQKRGLCGHLMAGCDKHSVCACCRDKKKGSDPFVKDKVCPYCDVLTEEQNIKLAIPAYQKKEKHELKSQAEESSSILVNPSLVSVIGVAKDSGGSRPTSAGRPVFIYQPSTDPATKHQRRTNLPTLRFGYGHLICY